MTMHRNPIWLLFLTIVFLITCVYSYKALTKAYRYVRLSSSVEAAATAWSVKSPTEDDYFPYVKYTYQVKDEFYDGETLFQDDVYHNPWAAEETVNKLAAGVHKVWYSPTDPSYSSLERKFPLKESISAGILWVLTIYFFWLGVYVAKMQK